MDRTERLLDLLALLLDSREPISWAELRDQFPDDYGKGSGEAAERKFERDKAELLELGIPITWSQGDDELKDGYIVERDAYYLPEVGLTPDEVAVLYAAGSAALASGAFPGSHDLAHALRKIGFFGGRDVPTPRLRMELGAVRVDTGEVASILEQLWAAAPARKFVEIVYRSPRGAGEVTRRNVDPYGLALRRGIWSLVGWCHLRKGIRTFHVHRIRSVKINELKPRTPDFDVPSDFRLDDYVAAFPWQYRFHPPVDVELTLTGELAPLASRLFASEEVVPGESRGASRVRVRATDLEGLLRYALSLGAACRVEGPEEAVNLYRQMAGRVLERHRGPRGER
jgi:proteasome accessory factor B